MSWLLHLYETYEANLDQVGKTVKNGMIENTHCCPFRTQPRMRILKFRSMKTVIFLGPKCWRRRAL
ncbi:hypothetical protein HMSSN139_65610 [Paenibacillus sp. HMSSN-139]|nr:hypothetical protein HMSSN139_65610 [Paenibacillus sp. HMSSN-139]